MVGVNPATGDVVVGIRVDTTHAQKNINDLIVRYEVLERTLVQALSLSARLTGDEDLQRGIMVIQRAIAVINQLQLASSLLVATNPWLWPLGILGFASAGLNMHDMFWSYYY
jgi:hypothetical protein